MDLGTSYVALFRRNQASPDNYAASVGALLLEGSQARIPDVDPIAGRLVELR